MEFHPNGQATGIGSLPHSDKQAAVSLVRDCLPVIPHWPQLPRTDYREFYLWQFMQLLQDQGLLRTTSECAAHFTTDEPEWPERLASFYDLYLRASSGDLSVLERFSFPPGAAEGFYAFVDDLRQQGTGRAEWLKGQVVGLLTVGFQITDASMRPSYYDPQLRDMLVKQLALQGAWQVKQYKKFGLPALIFMDDPVIDSCGRFDRVSVNRDEVMSELGEFAALIREAGSLAGVHSCAELDWSLLLEAKIDIVSFDAYQFGASFALFPELLQNFLAGGGVVAWGIVPTSGEFLAGETENSLAERMQRLLAVLCDKGVAPDLLKSQSLLTPACGAGTLSVPEAERIYRLTAALSERWEEICKQALR
jgi:hypothetical protein